jgi:hypothetical protein
MKSSIADGDGALELKARFSEEELIWPRPLTLGMTRGETVRARGEVRVLRHFL